MDEEDEEDVSEEEEEEREEEEGDEVDTSQSNLTRSVVRPSSKLFLDKFLFSQFRELGDEATWTLSSAKSGNGAEALRNGETQTYWQSDGSHPHTVTVQFHRRAALSYLAMYCDVRLDESYTPKKVRILSGNTVRDLELVVDVDLENPKGWVLIDLSDPERKSNAQPKNLRAFALQIQCVSMHQNGRDTHIRAMRLFGPRNTSTAEDGAGQSQYSVPDLFNYSELR